MLGSNGIPYHRLLVPSSLQAFIPRLRVASEPYSCPLGYRAHAGRRPSGRAAGQSGFTKETLRPQLRLARSQPSPSGRDANHLGLARPRLGAAPRNPTLQSS